MSHWPLCVRYPKLASLEPLGSPTSGLRAQQKVASPQSHSGQFFVVATLHDGLQVAEVDPAAVGRLAKTEPGMLSIETLARKK